MEVDDSLNFSFPAEPDVGELGDAEGNCLGDAFERYVVLNNDSIS